MDYHTARLQHVRILKCDPVARLSIFSSSGSSAISPGEKDIVVFNLFDGLDFYSIADRTLSRSVPCSANQQGIITPVLFNSDGSTVIVGGASGSVKLMDSRSCETIQVLPHDG